MASEITKRINGKTVVILVVGILSILIEEGIGFILGIVGVILYVINKKEIAQYPMPGKGIAIAGFICSIVGVVIQFLDIID